MGQVTAGVERHAQRPLVAQGEAELLPVGVGQVVDVRRPQLGERRRLDALGEDRPERDQVGVDARVRLNVRVGRTEQRLGVVDGRLLDDVDVLASGVEPVTDRALGVLVRQPRTHRQQRRRGRVVLAGDQLQRLALIGQLLADRGRHRRLDGADHIERTPIGSGRSSCVERFG